MSFRGEGERMRRGPPPHPHPPPLAPHGTSPHPTPLPPCPSQPVRMNLMPSFVLRLKFLQMAASPGQCRCACKCTVAADGMEWSWR